mgnify:CR=1 FL=1|jgi:hypothetical protein|tara:strand:+ start:1337 stop:1531 length:195 start_codon:yes stop_codon:yes gene_type:complete
MNSNKTYKVTVSASAYEYPYTFTTIYETEVEDCGSEDEAMTSVIHNDILGCGILELEVEEVDET